MKGYQQLQAIAEGLHQHVGSQTDNAFFQQWLAQVDRALAETQTLAESLQKAHHWLLNIAACLRYPPSSYPQQNLEPVTSQIIETEMTALLERFQQQITNNRVLTALFEAVNDRWHRYGQDLLHCYDIPGLPADNLHLESLFNHLRRHQRRINGRKSTKELRAFGQFQVLFLADSETALLEQMRRVPLTAYDKYRQRLAQAEAPRVFIHRLHRNPKTTVQLLLTRYLDRQAELSSSLSVSRPTPPSM